MLRWLVVVVAACSQGHDVPTIDCTVPVPTCTPETAGAMCGYDNADAARTRLCTCEGENVFVCNDCDTLDAPPSGMGCTAGDRCVWATVSDGCVCACSTQSTWVCTPSRPDTISC